MRGEGGQKMSVFVHAQVKKKTFPSISYYFYIPKIFDYLEFHCPTEEKIGIDEKVICYHNISN